VGIIENQAVDRNLKAFNQISMPDSQVVTPLGDLLIRETLRDIFWPKVGLRLGLQISGGELVNNMEWKGT
jgi:hypothetical protein